MATLVPFVKPADLQILSPGTSDAAAELVCDLVSAVIRNSINWDVDQVTTTYTKRVPRFRQYAPNTTVAIMLGLGNPYRTTATALWSANLPALNATAVSSVNVDGAVLDPNLYDWTTFGMVYLGVPAYQFVTVNYTAGWVRAPQDQAPGVFRTVAIEYAVRLAENPGGVTAYLMGHVSERFGADSDLRAFADEDSRLDPYRLET